MFALFRQFLVVRILEQIQVISKEKCQACCLQLRFDCLHPCIKTPILERVDLFLPQTKQLVLENLARLLSTFQMSFELQNDPNEYLNVGKVFVDNLQSSDILDRKYIHEETHTIHQPYDLNWVGDDDLNSVCQQLFGNTDDLDKEHVTPKVTKRKVTENGYNNDPIEIIADSSSARTHVDPPKRAYKKRKAQSYE